MIHFVSIAAFRTALEALLKVKRDVYAGVSDEICKAFQNVPVEQIRSNRDMILIDNESITIKLRLADKKHRLSKSDGYRLIYGNEEYSYGRAAHHISQTRSFAKD